MAGNFLQALGAALQMGGRTAGALQEQDEEQKRQKAYLDIAQQNQQAAAEERQRRIIMDAIEGADPNAELSQNVVEGAKKFGLDSRLRQAPVAKEIALGPSGINIGTSIDSMTNPNDHTGFFKRQTPQEALKDSQANFLRSIMDPNDNSLGLTPDQKKRFALTLQSGVNANEIMGPVAATSQIPGVGTKTGPDAMSSLSPADQNVVKALLDYRYKLPIGASAKDPYFKGLLQIANQIDPTFDATQYDARQALRKDFTSGKSGANIRSLNTVISHLGKMKTAMDDLNNSDYPLYNQIANWFVSQQGDPRVNNYGLSAQAVENELATLFKNTGATDQEIKAWRDKLSAASSPEQFQGIISTALDLIGGRAQALQDQWSKGMGKPRDFGLLSKESKGILQTLGGDPHSFDDTDLDYSPGASEDSPAPTAKPVDAAAGFSLTGKPSGPQVPQMTAGFGPGSGSTKPVDIVTQIAQQTGLSPVEVARRLKAAGRIR